MNELRLGVATLKMLRGDDPVALTQYAASGHRLAQPPLIDPQFPCLGPVT